MFKAMVQSPMGGERVEKVIFNISSTMTCFPKLTAGKLRKREGGRPRPMMIFDDLDPFRAETLSLGDGLIGIEHPERYLDSLGRGKAFHIPELS